MAGTAFQHWTDRIQTTVKNAFLQSETETVCISLTHFSALCINVLLTNSQKQADLNKTQVRQ